MQRNRKERPFERTIKKEILCTNRDRTLLAELRDSFAKKVPSHFLVKNIKRLLEENATKSCSKKIANKIYLRKRREVLQNLRKNAKKSFVQKETWRRIAMQTDREMYSLRKNNCILFTRNEPQRWIFWKKNTTKCSVRKMGRNQQKESQRILFTNTLQETLFWSKIAKKNLLQMNCKRKTISCKRNNRKNILHLQRNRDIL